MSNYSPPNLPLKVDLESKVVLKQVAAAHRRLAELKGLVMTIPNEEILISTLTLQEARDSSEIENIITTQDELFKAEYYRLLQEVRDDNRWEEWILFILQGVEETSIQTIELIKDIKKLMQEYKRKIRDELPKIYSQELLNNLFKHPYTKIDFVMEDVGIQRITASKYLDSLVSINLLDKYKIGRK